MAEDPALQDNPEGVDRPDWLPDNFKSPEDLAASYRESQRKITEEATARRNLEQLVAQQQAQLEAVQAQQAQQQQDEQPWDEWYAQDPIATQKAVAEQAARDAVAQYAQQSQQQAQPIAAAQAEIIATYAYKQLEDRYGTLSPEKQDQMRQTIAEHPHLLPEDAVYSPQKLVSALDMVYRLTGPDEAAAAQTQQDLMRTMKVQAQSASGATGRPSPADDAEQRWQEIANAQTGKLGL